MKRVKDTTEEILEESQYITKETDELSETSLYVKALDLKNEQKQSN